jgi:hypothetical protein
LAETQNPCYKLRYSEERKHAEQEE